MTIKELWTEKYRPKTIDDYVFRDERLKNQVESWIMNGAIPNLLLSGTQGIGKTALATLIFHELGECLKRINNEWAQSEGEAMLKWNSFFKSNIIETSES